LRNRERRYVAHRSILLAYTPDAADSGMKEISRSTMHDGLLIFGGTNVERDLNDLWLLQPLEYTQVDT
jgi:hypothetical protein